MPVFSVDGIVAQRDKMPYVRLLKDGEVLGQFSVAQAHNIAMDMLVMASRVEADAMIHKFFNKSSFPVNAANALMLEFRQFRLELDSETLETTISDPDANSKPA